MDKIAEIDYDDPDSEITAYSARNGEKLDPEEVCKGLANEQRELDDFEVRKWTSRRRRSLQARRSGPTGSRRAKTWQAPRYDPDSAPQKINTGKVRSDTFAATPPRKFVQLILSWAASYQPKRKSRSRMSVPMIIMVFDIAVAFFHGNVRKTIHVVPPKTHGRKDIFGDCSRASTEHATRSQVFATSVAEGLKGHGFQRSAVVPCLYTSSALETFRSVCIGATTSSSQFPSDLADDFEQVMREVLKVKICERVGPDFATSVEFLHRTVSWDAEGWLGRTIRNMREQWPKLLGSTAKKQLEQTNCMSRWLLYREL